MENNLSKPRLVEAGPGAGKTHSMVDKIVAAIQVLPPHKFLAAITYTNAAANMIRERLSMRIQLKHNIFVGTTHAFVNRFILAPYAALLQRLPEDRIYAAVDVHEKRYGAAIYTENLIKKGIVPYEAMIPKALEILEMSAIRDRICDRIAYIFVDEFQDTDSLMFEVYNHFLKGENTNLYVVGDPEQYVMNFTYYVRGQKPPPYEQIPFFRFKIIAETGSINKNHRSNGEIVTFANQFREDLKQQAIKPNRKEPRVLFISATTLEEIIRRYQVLSANIEIEEVQRTRLYLSKCNKTFDSVRNQFQLKHISNDRRKNKTLLGDALEILSLALDRSQRRVCEEFELSRIQWRAMGVRLLTNLRAGQYGINELIAFIDNEFDHKVSKSRIKLIEDDLSNLSAEVNPANSAQMYELYSSIHKAKGLQADAVLVVAKNLAELKKWLQRDHSCRLKDNQDECRLGYVAFTRPREMLCIACLKELDKDLFQMLDNLDIVRR